jgi:hypothetical protein
MDKVAIQVSGDPAFFNEVTYEAARLDRSPSWLLVYCVGTTLPKLAKSIVAMPKPSKKTKAEAKQRMWTFFVPRDLVEHCGRLAARLGMSSDEVLAYAWQAGRDGLRAMPSS